jgi:hypothetical protein
MNRLKHMSICLVRLILIMAAPALPSSWHRSMVHKAR